MNGCNGRRRRALLALTTGMLVPEAALVKAAEQCGQG